MEPSPTAALGHAEAGSSSGSSSSSSGGSQYTSAVDALSELRDEANNKGRQVPIVCPGHSRPIAEVAYSAETQDGSFLISACHDKQPMLREGKSGDWIGTFFGHKGAVWSAKLDSRAVLAATGAGDFTATIWNAVTGEEVQSMVHRHVVKTVDFSPDDRCLATGGNEGLLRIFSLDRGDAPPEVLKHSVGGETSVPTSASAPGAKAPFINKAVWLSNQTICTGANDGIVRLWDVRTKTAVRLLVSSVVIVVVVIVVVAAVVVFVVVVAVYFPLARVWRKSCGVTLCGLTPCPRDRSPSNAP
jgi:WD40 repeat protein